MVNYPIAFLAIFMAVAPATAQRWPSVAGPERWRPFVDQLEEEHRDPSLVVEDAYRAVLVAWSEGFRLQAGEALAELEVRLFHGDRRDPSPTCFEQMRRNTLEELARQDPESLVPVLALEVEAWWHHLDHSYLVLADEKRRHVSQFAELYLGQIQDGGEVLARLFLTWGGRMAGSVYLDALEASAEVLDEALRHDPDNRTALELAARTRERLGDDADALELYERLLARDADDAEIRLHATLTGLRTGHGDADLLALARDARMPAWIRTLAFEESARRHASEGRPEEAAALVDEALTAFPADERLRVQRAALAVLHGGGGPELAEAVLAGWDGDVGETPRLRYEDPPRSLAGESRRHDEDVAARRPALRRAVDAITRDDAVRTRFSVLCRTEASRLKGGPPS